MKYFFVLDKSDKRHIVVAENIDKAVEVIEKAGIKSGIYVNERRMNKR